MAINTFNPFETYVTGILQPEIVNNIIQRIDTLELIFENGCRYDYDAGEERFEDDSRRCKVAWVEDQPLKSFVYSEFQNANKKSDWKYVLDSIEHLQYTVYNSNDHFDWHKDYVSNPEYAVCRKLSMTIVLSEQGIDYEGGYFEFQYLDQGKIHNEQLSLKKGDILVFPSTMNHRVSPITSGVRKVLVGWAWGPTFV